MHYSEDLREKGYQYLIQTVKRICPDLEIGRCLETVKMFDVIEMQAARGRCNCVL